MTPHTRPAAPVGRSPRTLDRRAIRVAAISLVTLSLPSGCDRGGNAPSSAKSPPAAPVVNPTIRPNVVMLLIDTLRADHLGFMGYERPTSPAMDRWAAEGIVFERAIAPAPWTVPSIASIFTALNPSVHHLLDHRGKYGTAGAPVQGDVLPPDVETLAESFAAGGYQTCGVVANSWLTRGFGFDQGFGAYECLDPRDRAYVPAREVIATASRWLGSRKPDQPFFLYLHVMDVHAPYNASEESRRPFIEALRRQPASTEIKPGEIRPGYIAGIANKTQRLDRTLLRRPEYWQALYDAGITDLDAQLRDLERLLTEAGLWKQTLLVVTADHGEALYEQGGWSHGMSPYHHQLHVPLLLHCPARWSEPRRIASTVGLTALKPTLLELTGLASSAFSQTGSFASLLQPDAISGDGFAFSEGVKYFNHLKTAYSGDYKIVYDSRREQSVWFDLRSDPLEQRRDPVPREDARLDRIYRRLLGTIRDNQSNEQRIPRVAQRRSAAQQNTLTQLGYTVDSGPEIPWPPYGAFFMDPAHPDPWRPAASTASSTSSPQGSGAP